MMKGIINEGIAAPLVEFAGLSGVTKEHTV